MQEGAGGVRVKCQWQVDHRGHSFKGLCCEDLEDMQQQLGEQWGLLERRENMLPADVDEFYGGARLLKRHQ